MMMALPTPPAPRTDQFGREDDPRIAQVTQSEQFAKIAKDVDPRGFLEKIKDDFLGAVGASTTSQEYQKALDELAVGVANYTSDVEEQNKLMAEIRGNLNQATRTELGMEKAPLVTAEEIAAQKIADQYSDMKAGDFDFYGDAGVGVETALVTEKLVQEFQRQQKQNIKVWAKTRFQEKILSLMILKRLQGFLKLAHLNKCLQNYRVVIRLFLQLGH